MASGWLLAWGYCAFLACLAVDPGQQTCNSTQYEHHGRCCNKCSPGHKVRTECAGEANTVCDPCEPHHFQDSWTKETHCTPHRDCDANAGLVVQRPGNATRNAVCRCKEGTHCSSQECQTCRTNKPCGAGEGVLQEANGADDTICVECSHGSFSNHSSATARCQPWSSCEAKQLVKKANGTRVSDVVCAQSCPLIVPAQSCCSGLGCQKRAVKRVCGARKASCAGWTACTIPQALQPGSVYAEVADVQTSSEKHNRIHSLPVVLGSLAAVGILIGGAGLFLWCQNRRELQKRHLNQEPRGRLQPEEYDDECPALPVQETLVGGQPVAQEDGKDSHLAEQEHL